MNASPLPNPDPESIPPASPWTRRKLLRRAALAASAVWGAGLGDLSAQGAPPPGFVPRPGATLSVLRLLRPASRLRSDEGEVRLQRVPGQSFVIVSSQPVSARTARALGGPAAFQVVLQAVDRGGNTVRGRAPVQATVVPLSAQANGTDPDTLVIVVHKADDPPAVALVAPGRAAAQ